METTCIQSAIKHYQAVLRANNNRNARLRQAKIDAGTYRGRGRPRKVELPKQEAEGDVV